MYVDKHTMYEVPHVEDFYNVNLGIYDVVQQVWMPNLESVDEHLAFRMGDQVHHM